MASDDELLHFVRDALARGQPRQRIEGVLLQAGWGKEQVRDALAAYAEVDFPVPVPRPKPYVSAKEAFLYLMLFSTLYVSAYNLGRLLFSFIDRALPDPARAGFMLEYTSHAMRWSIASLVIAFPVFLYLSWLLGRAIRREPMKRASRLRKWLTYLTLFMAASILVGDLITLLYSFLGGELGLRFLLKVLTVGAIAGTVFTYYLLDIRSDDAETGR